MEDCPSTIEDNKRHRYQDANLKVQREEETENVFVQKDGLSKKKKKEGSAKREFAGQYVWNTTLKFIAQLIVSLSRCLIGIEGHCRR